MPLKIRHRFQIDEGTKTVEPIGGDSIDISEVGNEPTGEAKSTLVREVTATEHKEDPTGAADTSPGETVNADWPAAETKTTTKTTAKKTTAKTTKSKK